MNSENLSLSRPLDLPHITLLQAVAFLSVIIGHACAPFCMEWYGISIKGYFPTIRGIHHFIYSFHMPFFFFLSGYLYAVRNRLGWLDYNVKRFKRLMIPYYTVGLLLRAIERYCIPPVQPISSFVGFLKGHLLFQANGHLWFLPTMFLAFFVYTLLMATFLRKHIYVMLIITAICSYYCNLLPIRLLRQSCFYMFFVHLGYIFAVKKVSFSSKTFIYFIVGGILCIVISDLLLRLRWLSTPSYLSILFYMLAYISSSKIPHLSVYPFIKYLSINMFVMYLATDPAALVVLKASLNFGVSPMSIFLLLNFATLAELLIWLKVYSWLKNKFSFRNNLNLLPSR